MPKNVKYYKSIDNEKEVLEAFAVFATARGSVEFVKITKYKSGFCEVKRYGRASFHRKARHQEITEREFKLRFVNALQFLQATVKELTTETSQTSVT